MAEIGFRSPLFILGFYYGGTIPPPPTNDEIEQIGGNYSYRDLTAKVYRSILIDDFALHPIIAVPMLDYTHDIQADGGYWTASLTFSTKRKEIDDWYVNGVGRHIEIKDHAQVTIWEGCINEVIISDGDNEDSSGKLTDIVNRGRLNYNEVTYNTNFPVGGDASYTDIVENLISQAKYGIWHTNFDGSDIDDADAEQLINILISENSKLQPSQQLSDSTNPENVGFVTLNCVGYSQLFQYYYYTNENDGESSITDQLKLIIQASPNSIFSSEYGGIGTNTRTTATFNEDVRAWTLIKKLLVYGDDDYNRWLFGIYNRCRATYNPVPNKIEYIYYSTKGRTKVVHATNKTTVYPWNLLPGKWMFRPDFLKSKLFKLTTEFGNELKDDPRNMFIESVKFTSPDQFELTGSRVSKLTQKLNAFGLGGI